MGRLRELVIKELVEGCAGNSYWQYWYGSVPPDGSAYIVHEDDWTAEAAELPVRHIYSWTLTRGPEK